MKTYEATEQAYKNGYEQGKKDALAKDNNVPSKWIPVSERLPEQFESNIFPEESIDVLVYREYYDEIRVGHYDFHWKEWYTVDDLLMGRVTHWMPLPEPPKGE